MDAISPPAVSLDPRFSYSFSSLSVNTEQANLEYKSLVIATSLPPRREDAVNLDQFRKNRALSLSADEILARINEELKGVLPEGVESLSPAEATPEATADRVVNSIMGLYEAFAKSRPELTDEERVNAFFEQARKGVEEGYRDAYELLKGLGAFEFEGVEDGVVKTKELIHDGLAAGEAKLREALGLTSSSVAEESAAIVNQGLREVAGGKISVIV